MVHILASGVIVSGFIKDFWCLPRPLSPPLQRITMSGSAALEYGFPSTHSTNAVSVAVYVLYLLHGDSTLSAPAKMGWQVIFYFYAFSIVLGRLYCGMHGFFDVVVGSVLGAAISLVQCAYGEAFDLFIHQASGKDMLIIVLAILVLVRIHPEPADDCPCFDDSVAFAGVVIGIEYGSWHFSDTQYAWSQPTPGTVPFDLASMGWTVTIARIVMGVMVIFAWRGSMKPVLFRTLPPIFRVIERLGLSLPRKFFKQASQYTRIPQPGPDDNVIPALSQIPSFLTWMRHPRRRSISIGPQSEADAYETLAYRQKRRRNSLSAGDGSRRRALSRIVSDDGEARPHSPRTDVSNGTISPAGGRMSQLERYERLMGTGFEPARPAEAGPVATSAVQAEKVEFPDAKREEEEMFSRILKPRVRYDVEVITKLIIYSGERQLSSRSPALHPSFADRWCHRYRVACGGGKPDPL